MENLKLNTIWLSDNEETMYKGNLIIVDRGKYDIVATNLVSKKDYIDGLQKEYKEHKKGVIVNEYKKVYDLCRGNYDEEFCLADLFDMFEVYDRGQEIYQEFADAEMMVKELNKSGIDKQMFKKMVMKMWPNFGFFSFNCLDFLNIEKGDEYNIKELEKIKSLSRKNNVGVSFDVEEILNQIGIAKTNSKVLEFSKKVNAISKK